MSDDPANFYARLQSSIDADTRRERKALGPSDGTPCALAFGGYLSESWSMLKDSVYAAQEAIRAGIENTQELLADHDVRLGRTTRGNRYTAERLEGEIRQMGAALDGLQKPNGCSYGESSPMAPDGVRRQVDLSPENAGGMARELAAPEMLKALLEIYANPGWQDPEVGYMSGHIAAHAIRKALGAEAGNAALRLSRHSVPMKARPDGALIQEGSL